MDTLLSVQVRRKSFGQHEVLRQLVFDVRPGEVVSLVGASGCGKSTALRIVAGLDREHDGEVFFEGRRLQGPDRRIGFIFQEPRLFPWLNVAENVGFDLRGDGAADPRVRALIHEVGLGGLEQALPKQLSGGQAQRVALARGLYREPRLLLLDEPFSAVDTFTRMKLQALLTGLVARHGVTVLMVTHDLDEAVFLSDRVLVLDHRPVPLRAAVEVALARPRERDADALAGCRVELLHALKAAHAL